MVTIDSFTLIVEGPQARNNTAIRMSYQYDQVLITNWCYLKFFTHHVEGSQARNNSHIRLPLSLRAKLSVTLNKVT